MERFLDSLKNNQILVFLMSDDSYNDNLYSLVKILYDISEKICYVTLNKPFITLDKDMRGKGIDTKNMFFIDAVTMTVSQPIETEACRYVANPGCLTDLSLEISRAFKKWQPDCIIIDSLSTLLFYEKPITIARFCQNIATKIRTYDPCKGIMTSLKNEVDSFILHELNMISDGVYHVD